MIDIDINSLKTKLCRYHICFVPGFLSQIFNDLENTLLKESKELIEKVLGLIPEFGPKILKALPELELPMEKNSGATFEVLKSYLKSINIPFTDLADCKGFHSQLGVQNNALAIRNVLLKLIEENSYIEILMVTHSKGGMDFLHCLLHHPEVTNNIKGWIAYQSPFYGTEIADMAPDIISKIALESTGGRLESAKDLETERRVEYMNEHHDSIVKLLCRIPTISAGSIYTPDFGEASLNIVKVGLKEAFSTTLLSKIWSIWRSGLEITKAIGLAVDAVNETINKSFINIMKETAAFTFLQIQLEQKSDGVVPYYSTKLPGAFHVLLPECDHLCATVNPMPFRRYYDNEDMIDIFNVLVFNLFNYLETFRWKEFEFPHTLWIRLEKEKELKEKSGDSSDSDIEQFVQFQDPSFEIVQKYPKSVYNF
eukprot:TRINITY_DN6040_c0_g1_i1.p1 TRINITY_DN6040_c0_g1~~TRINITY_DN6040_c0_g1_i1.p1  ORF type:complete len:425 (-),score=113.79 TRINITY_DN6040_c0_g1_i1:68-1342(-)